MILLSDFAKCAYDLGNPNLVAITGLKALFTLNEHDVLW